MLQLSYAEKLNIPIWIYFFNPNFFKCMSSAFLIRQSFKLNYIQE